VRDQLPTILALGAAMSRSGNTAAEAGHKIGILVNSLINLARMQAQGDLTGNRYVLRLKAAAGEALNADAFDSAGKFRKLLDVIADIENAANGMNEEQRAIFEQTAFRKQATDLLETVRVLRLEVKEVSQETGEVSTRFVEGADAIQHMENQLRGTIGTLQSASNESRGLTSEIRNQLKVSIDELASSIGKGAAPMFNTFSGLAANVVGWLARVAETAGVGGSALINMGIVGVKAFDSLANSAMFFSQLMFNLLGIMSFMKSLGLGTPGLTGFVSGSGGSLVGKLAGAALLGLGMLPKLLLGAGLLTGGYLLWRAFTSNPSNEQVAVSATKPAEDSTPIPSRAPASASASSSSNSSRLRPFEIRVQSTGKIDRDVLYRTNEERRYVDEGRRPRRD